MSEQESDNVALYVACPGCVSFSTVESRTEGHSTAASHNGSSHGGEEIATTINVRNESELGDFVNEVKEHAPGDEYMNFVRRLSKGNSAFFCSARMFREVVPQEDQVV